MDPARVDHHEAVTRHDVIAFTTAVAEKIGPISRYIHFGLTSSDVVDTSLSLQIQEAGAILRADVEQLLKTLRAGAQSIGACRRSGARTGFSPSRRVRPEIPGLACGMAAKSRATGPALERLRLRKALGRRRRQSALGPEFEARSSRLGLKREPVSTQVIPRDRHAEF